MSTPLTTLTDDEVRQITQLVETLERSTFDFLQIEIGELKVTIGKGPPPAGEGHSQPSVARVAATEVRTSAPVQQPAPAATPSAPKAASPSVPDGTVTVVSPMIGRFYAKPEPGAPPFVSLGMQVGADSTVALVEVMKVFTAVAAGVKGVVTEICVQDEQLVEYGQVLFRIRPD